MKWYKMECEETPFDALLCEKHDKNSHKMRQITKIMAIFALRELHWEPSLIQGAQLRFSLSENLENSKVMGPRAEGCSPAVRMSMPRLAVGACSDICQRVWATIHSSLHRYSRTFRQRMSEGSHFVCLCETI